MISDSKAVSLIANALYQVKCLAVTRQHHRLRFTFLENQLELLGQSHHRHLQMPCLLPDDFQRRGKLSLAAVNDNEIRQFLLGQSHITASGDFSHGKEVIRLAFCALNLEAPVILFLGQSPLEDYHGSHSL